MGRFLILLCLFPMLGTAATRLVRTNDQGVALNFEPAVDFNTAVCVYDANGLIASASREEGGQVSQVDVQIASPAIAMLLADTSFTGASFNLQPGQKSSVSFKDSLGSTYTLVADHTSEVGGVSSCVVQLGRDAAGQVGLVAKCRRMKEEGQIGQMNFDLTLSALTCKKLSGSTAAQ